MPEYLAPGVFVEEVSFRSKSIEGVPTSTTGMAGMTRYGPVQHGNGPTSTEPRLITSFTEFERVYGGLEPLLLDDGTLRDVYLGHAARAFFINGGKRLYVSRVFSAGSDSGVASALVTVTGASDADPAEWTARWPGRMGNVAVTTLVRRSRDLAHEHTGFGVQARRVTQGAVVEIVAAGAGDPGDHAVEALANLGVVTVANDGRQTFVKDDGSPWTAPDLVGKEIRLVELDVQVEVGPDRVDYVESLAAHPDQKRDALRILDLHDPEDPNTVVALTWGASRGAPFDAAALLKALAEQGTAGTVRLEDGNDGQLMAASDLEGSAADPDDASDNATGLYALAEIDDVAIVATPDAASLGTEDEIFLATQALIGHAERDRYRIAVVDAPEGSSMTEIREFRNGFDSKYAALYHPWIEVLDPLERPSQGAPPRKLLLPPSGFVTGIYARSDIERGVHKAPANEVVRGLTRFETNITKPRQEVLNPEGINALRHFEGRGYRVWGARTMSSDPEWKYVNVRRLFIFVEHSIDKATQWAVFEPNNRHLWANIRSTVEDFLLTLWLQGALMGAKAEEAYFVRCDRTTMTQNDIDNGRMVCLVGIAPTKPAEFVIFRIGQWTADAQLQ